MERKKAFQLRSRGKQCSISEKEYKGLLKIYDKYYLQLLIIPLIILIISLAQISLQVAQTGDFLIKGVTLRGGITVTVPVTEPIEISEARQILSSAFPGVELDIRSATELGAQKALIITTSDFDAGPKILEALEERIPGAKENSSTENTGSALGESFFEETMKAMLFAFVFMGIVVFISFRTFAPSMMVIFAVFADIVMTIATANVLGISFTGAGIAALLMLIGYSVDTDILLTSRVLRSKEGTVFERILSAAKTGLMLTATAIIAVTIGLVMTQNEVIKEIMIIMLIGLAYDIINTWIQNVALIRYYAEKIKPRKMAAAAARYEREDETEDETEEGQESIDEEDGASGEFYAKSDAEKKESSEEKLGDASERALQNNFEEEEGRR